MLPLVGSLGLPYLAGEDFGFLVLHYAVGIGGDTLSCASVPLHEQFVELSVLECARREVDFPVAVIDRLQAICLVFLPSVHVADDVDGGSVRCPLA